MTNTGKVTLQCASVNGGVAVNLNCFKATYSIKNNLRADPYASSFTLTDVEHRGWENPMLSIQGVIQDVAGTNYVTETLLKQFAKVKNELLVINIVYGSDTHETTFSNMDGSTTVGSYTGIPVLIQSVDFDLDPSESRAVQNQIFSMTLIEDKYP